MFIKQEDILSHTNGGLDIILSYYPQARDCISGTQKAFKARTDERTPSASIKKLGDGNYIVTDFGGDQIPRNAIQICMLEDNLTYREAIVTLAGRYNINGIQTEINRPISEKRDALETEKEGEYIFDIKDEITENELQLLGAKVTKEVCKKYNVYALNSFTKIKNRTASKKSSTENYPVFLFDHGEFKKIYEPLNPDKGFRFQYAGTKEKDIVYGLKQAVQVFNDMQNANDETEDTEKKKEKKKRIPELIIASGERDALNVAGLGWQVVWFNSETARIEDTHFKELSRIAEKVYLLPDIDQTGREAAIRHGLNHLDLYIVWLPDSLGKYKDKRGNPRKDFTDYVEIYPRVEDFKRLLAASSPLRFWDKTFSEHGEKYSFNNQQMFSFLEACGFSRIENKNSKTSYSIVKLDKNIVTEIDSCRIKEFVLEYCREKMLNLNVKNLIHRTKQLSDSSLVSLRRREFDFENFDKNSQYLFFQNCAFRITADNVEEIKNKDMKKYVWSDEIFNHTIKRTQKSFTVNEDYNHIDLKNTESPFLRFLINTSRIHWRNEEKAISILSDADQGRYWLDHKFCIDSNLLDAEEITEQKIHLINKIFSIGYLMHRYKEPSKPWCVFAMDSKISEIGESHGRSGKSVCYKALRLLMRSVTLSGRNPKLTDNPHIYDRVTEHTKYVVIDDADQYLNFQFFFDALTGDLPVNPKNNKSYEIPFDKSPKFVITSNYTLRNIDPSTMGRVLFTVFSDWYHEKTDDSDYQQTRKISDDFGKSLFNDYNEAEWNADINFFADCLSFYLTIPNHIKIDPPMANVIQRTLLTNMGENFKSWADSYFVSDETLNKEIPKQEMIDDFTRKTNLKTWSSQRFMKSLRSWAKYNNYILNPPDLCNDDKRIIRKLDNKSVEHLFISTTIREPGVDLPF